MFSTEDLPESASRQIIETIKPSFLKNLAGIVSNATFDSSTVSTKTGIVSTIGRSTSLQNLICRSTIKLTGTISDVVGFLKASSYSVPNLSGIIKERAGIRVDDDSTIVHTCTQPPMKLISPKYTCMLSVISASEGEAVVGYKSIDQDVPAVSQLSKATKCERSELSIRYYEIKKQGSDVEVTVYLSMGFGKMPNFIVQKILAKTNERSLEEIRNAISG